MSGGGGCGGCVTCGVPKPSILVRRRGARRGSAAGGALARVAAAAGLGLTSAVDFFFSNLRCGRERPTDRAKFAHPLAKFSSPARFLYATYSFTVRPVRYRLVPVRPAKFQDTGQTPNHPPPIALSPFDCCPPSHDAAASSLPIQSMRSDLHSLCGDCALLLCRGLSSRARAVGMAVCSSAVCDSSVSSSTRYT